MIPDYVSIVYQVNVDTAPGKINWCQTWLGITLCVRSSQIALCLMRSSAYIFTHMGQKKPT